MTGRTWRDLSWREWVIPPPDGTITWHPLWDTLRAAFCAFLLLYIGWQFYDSFSWWGVLLIVVLVGGMAS